MNLTAHPEWKRLFAAIEPLLPDKIRFSYDELQELGGVDIRSDRGRKQMLTFQWVALNKWGKLFECEPKFGYVVTAADEHPGCAARRMKKGLRQYRRALDVATLTSDEGATPRILAAKRQIAASCGAILLAAALQQKEIQQVQRPGGSDPAALVATLV